MMRHRRKRCVGFQFNGIYYKPRGVPLRHIEEVQITPEELETLRLRHIEKLDQESAARRMGVSQSQYQRDLTAVHEKITSALIKGCAINISDSE